MSFAYNLVGQLKQITDPAGAVIDYSFDKTGRLKTVTGSPFAGVTQYIGDVSYRAWNAAKQVSYDGTQTATMSYNNRMLVAQFALNGVTANYSYRNDGRVNGLTSSDAKLNRTFGYDDFGRISSSVGGGGTEPEQFNQSYGYDVFNNFTSRSGRYWWVNGNQSYTAGWVNGRMVSANENGTTISAEHTPSGQMIRSWSLVQGNQVTKDGPFRYDAVGRVTGEGAVSASNPEQTIFYDGDGRMVKDLRNSLTTYSIRASALGGGILTLLNASGQKSQTHIYAGGNLIATQDVSSSQYIYYWRRDPHNTLSFAGSGSSPNILDPLNVSVSPATATQIQQYWQNQYQPPGGYGNPNGVGYGAPSTSGGTICKRDGQPFDCKYLLNQINNGFAGRVLVTTPGGLGGFDAESGALLAAFGLSATNLNGRPAEPRYIRHEENATGHKITIAGEVLLDKIVGKSRVWYEVQYPELMTAMIVDQQQDPRAQTGLDNLEKALDLAAQALSENLPCVSILAGDGDKDDPQFLGDPSTLLGWLRANKRIQPGDAGTNIAQVPILKKGAKSSIILSHKFFAPDVGGLTRDYGISASYARALVILHELGHATGGYAHGRLAKLFGYKAHRETGELDKEIIRKCFGTPLPNNVS